MEYLRLQILKKYGKKINYYENKRNKKAPNFKLLSTNNEIVELNKIKNKNIILYFYHKDATPGCTLVAKDFSKLSNLIKRSNCLIFGVSKDSIKSHLKFKKKYNIKFDLLSDEKLIVLKKYNVWKEKMFMGKNFMGIVRTTFLIGKNKKVNKIWNNVRVKYHTKEVLNALKFID